MQTNVSSTVKGHFDSDLTGYLKINSLIAITYFMSAGLALLFSIPPDHFAPFFIPAGISLAVCVSFGNRVLPGIILGAGCFNLYTLIFFRSAEGHVLLMIIAVCAAAGGSALQAWVGARLFVRFSDQKLASGTSIIFFLLIVPISSLIAASIGILSFWKLGLVSPENLAPNWLIWWFGDTVGAVLGAALTWILVGRPRALWRRRFWLLGVPLLLTSFGFLALYSGVRGWEEERRRYAFAINAQQVADLVQFQFEEHERFLFLAAQAINESDINSQEKFSRLARGYLENRPELRLLSMARQVAEKEKGDFQVWVRANVSSNFSIKSTSAIKESANGQATPHTPKEFFPTIFVEPMRNNEAILGMDLLSESVRSDMVRRALDRKTAAASAPIQLLQSGNNSPAILLGQRLELRFPESLTTDLGVLVVVIEIEPYIGKTLARAGFSGRRLSRVDRG
ncbi:MAG: CHASE domain-containing protein [Pseudomonadota bacterium]